MANPAHILCFHMEPNKIRQIESICRTLKIRVSKINRNSYSQKLGYLAGITGFNRENISYNGEEFPTEMLVFSGMDSELVDKFLEMYHSAALPAIHLKAILTPHNIFWTAEKLFAELWREHSAIH